MLNIKEKDILQFLIKNKERFVTSKELAEYYPVQIELSVMY
ncbi:TPA: HTH domain-containing protein [Streptococcus pneumoniae]|nr:HTH domain-containing protein [Streptococcus pneumoniae]